MQTSEMLGSSFALLRAGYGVATGWMDGNGNILYDYAGYDLAAVSELLKSRTEQARLLLESELTFRPSSLSRPKF